MLACKYLQVLILVYPWRYSPVAVFWRWRRRLETVEKPAGERHGGQTDYNLSTRDLISRGSQDSAPEIPRWTDARTESVDSMAGAKE